MKHSMPNANGLLAGIPAAAEYAEVSERRIKRWMWTGLLPFHQMGEANYLFRPEDVDFAIEHIEFLAQAQYRFYTPELEISCPYASMVEAFFLQMRVLRPNHVQADDVRNEIDAAIEERGLDSDCVSAFISDAWVCAAFCRLKGVPVNRHATFQELEIMTDRGQLPGLTRIHDVYPGERGFVWRVGNPPPGTLRVRITSWAPKDGSTPGVGWAASRPEEDSWPS